MLKHSKSQETNYTSITKGRPSELFILNNPFTLVSTAFGDDPLLAMQNPDCYFIEDVQQEKKAGDIILTKIMADGTTAITRGDVKAAHWPNEKNVALEISKPAYFDEERQKAIPQQNGWFAKRGVDWYAFVYVDKDKNPVRVVGVKEEELWSFYHNNKERYKPWIMASGDEASCALVPYLDILQNCPSAQATYFHPSGEIDYSRTNTACKT